MGLEIIEATYGGKDVTNILKRFIKNDKLIIHASNGYFGDPMGGVVKKLIVKYKLNDFVFEKITIENNFLKIPETNTDRLGIFYTNNNIDNNLLSKSIKSIDKASNKHGVDILTCSWKPIPDNPFIEIISRLQQGNHFNIAFQILTLLITANDYKKYKYVDKKYNKAEDE